MSSAVGIWWTWNQEGRGAELFKVNESIAMMTEVRSKLFREGRLRKDLMYEMYQRDNNGGLVEVPANTAIQDMNTSMKIPVIFVPLVAVTPAKHKMDIQSLDTIVKHACTKLGEEARAAEVLRYFATEWIKSLTDLQKCMNDGKLWGTLRIPARLKLELKSILMSIEKEAIQASSSIGTSPLQHSPTVEFLLSLDTLEGKGKAELMHVKLYTPAEGAPSWLKVPLPMQVAATEDTSPVDCGMPVPENPFYENMGNANLNDLLELTNLRKGYHHVLLLGCSGCGKTAACLALASARFVVYLEYTDEENLVGTGRGYRTDHSTWTKGTLRSESGVWAAFNMEVAARLVVLKHLLEAMGSELTPLRWLLYVQSDEGARRVGGVIDAIKLGRYRIEAYLVEQLLDKVNLLLRRTWTPAPAPVVLVVDELQTLENKMVLSIREDSEISLTSAVVSAACSVSAAVVWSGTRRALSDAMGDAMLCRETSSWAKGMHDSRMLMVAGRYAYLEKQDVAKLMTRLLDLSGVSQVVREQLFYGLQGRARTCAGFVAYLLSSRLARGPQASAPLDDAVLSVFEEYVEKQVVRVHKELEEMKQHGLMRTDDIGLLWCHSMLPIIRDECCDRTRLNCIAFTVRVRVVTEYGQPASRFDPPSTAEAPIEIYAGLSHEYDYHFGEPTMQEAMLRLVRADSEVAERGIRSLLASTLNGAGMGARLDYAVAMPLLYKPSILQNLTAGTDAFGIYAGYTLSLSRIVSTNEAAHQLEWFEKMLNDPEDCTFSQLPGVPVKNIAILPSILSGADVICVAVCGGSTDQPYIQRGQNKKSRTTTPPMVILHTCCANYHNSRAAPKEHESQLEKSGPQFQSARKCFVGERYKMVAGAYADALPVIPILFEMPQRDLPSAIEKNYVLVSDQQNWEHVFGEATMQLLGSQPSTQRGSEG